MSEPGSSHLPPFDRDAFRAELADRLTSAIAEASHRRAGRSALRRDLAHARDAGLRHRHAQKLARTEKP